MKSILSVLADIDRGTPDGLLLQIAATGAKRVTILSHPRRGHHGSHSVAWMQDGAVRSAEGSTLDIALRRALRAASRFSASIETAP